ncbi:MAG: glycosyltransferase family 4 protein [Chloroflexi bacterium]|nr:glycosyltransferase family 4 protein [Chloroflexota bacterium]
MNALPRPQSGPRVGLITYALDRATGGIARYTRELRAALLRAGLPLTILQAGRELPPSPTTVQLPGAGLLPGLMTVGQAEIAWAARRHDLDLVHDPTGVSPLLLTTRQRVATIHDVIPLIYPAASTTLDRLIYHRWLPSVARRLDAILTVSECSRHDIVRLLRVDPARVHVTPNAVGPEFAPATPEQITTVTARQGITGPYLLYVGSVEARKNLTRLLHAFAALPEDARGWQLVIVGASGWKSSPVYATVEQLRLGDRVRFLGFVPDADLPALYSGADLFVFPSLYEGFGLPVLEAMACGTAVITSSTSSLPEIAGDAARLCDPLDVPGLTTALRELLREPAHRQELAARGLARAAQFTWDRTAQATLDVYRGVTGGIHRVAS